MSTMADDEYLSMLQASGGDHLHGFQPGTRTRNLLTQAGEPGTGQTGQETSFSTEWGQAPVLAYSTDRYTGGNGGNRARRFNVQRGQAWDRNSPVREDGSLNLRPVKWNDKTFMVPPTPQPTHSMAIKDRVLRNVTGTRNIYAERTAGG